MELPPSTAPSSPDDPHAPLLDIRGLVKRYPSRQGEGTLIFDGLDLSVRENEFVALLGHSGSGKSTLLRMIAGLEPITDGIVEVAGRPVTGPGQDRMMIFQHYALLPWLTVEGNIRLAVDEVRKDRSREERAAIVREHIAMVHLEHAAGKRPHELSGGMRQRVGIARALAVEPRLLLMDEPLGALDPFTRAKLQDQILELYDTRRQTVLLVTHDVDEALLMADRIVVLKANGVSSVGEVIEVPFARPRDRKALREDRHYHDLRNATLDLLEQYFETMQAAP